MKIYLAGPEVFFPDGFAFLARKYEIAAGYGFAPALADPDEDLPEDPLQSGLELSRRNEDKMRAADVVIANVTPFRGISADVGTIYELGFMAASGKAVYAYTNDGRDYNDRAVPEYYGGQAQMVDGLLRAPDGQMVEVHGMADNLMIDGGVILRGGVVVRPDAGALGAGPCLALDDLRVFEKTLAIAREALLGGVEKTG